MQRLVVVGVLALVLAATPATVVGATAPSDVQQEFDREEFTIHVESDGSAYWTFRYQRVLSNQTERTQFESFAREFNDERTPAYENFVERADALTAVGANETDRPMNATDFDREAYVRTGVNDVGVVEMSFRWTNFTVVEGDRLIVGDVFEGGLTVGADQRLVVTWDESLAPVEVAPEPTQSVDETGDALIWQGEEGGTQFLDQQPRVVFAPASTVGTATPAVPTDDGAAVGGDRDSPADGGIDDGGIEGTPGGGDGAPADGDDTTLWPFAFGAVVVVVLGGLAYQQGYLEGDGGDGNGEGDPTTPAATGRPPGAPPAASPPEPAVADEELLGDEDRVHSLLAENGGRMKQVRIVEETGWSKSKVSMLLSEMEEDGEIHKLRVGRENVISRAGDEPDATRSPFDDE